MSTFNNSSSKKQTACCPNLYHQYCMFYYGYLISGHSNLYLYIVNLYTGKIIRKLLVVSPQELSSQLLTLLASRVSYIVYWILGRRPNIQTRQSTLQQLLNCSKSFIPFGFIYKIQHHPDVQFCSSLFHNKLWLRWGVTHLRWV